MEKKIFPLGLKKLDASFFPSTKWLSCFVFLSVSTPPLTKCNIALLVHFIIAASTNKSYMNWSKLTSSPGMRFRHAYSKVCIAFWKQCGVASFTRSSHIRQKKRLWRFTQTKSNTFYSTKLLTISPKMRINLSRQNAKLPVINNL